MDGSARASAYADLLSALLALRTDPATARFDAELAAAEAAGLVDGQVARTLRWWQRESMRGLADHLAAVLPDLLTELRDADRAAVDTVEAARASWAEATAPVTGHLPPSPGTEPGPGPTTPPSAPAPGGSPFTPGPHLRPVDDLGTARPADDPRDTRPSLRKAGPDLGPPPVDRPIVPGPGTGSAGDDRPGPAAPVLRAGFAPGPDSPGPESPAGGTPVVPVRPGQPGSWAPPPRPRTGMYGPDPVPAGGDDAPADPAASEPSRSGAPRRRLLVAGLTVLTGGVEDPPPPAGPGATGADGGEHDARPGDPDPDEHDR
ncbi:MAG: hypothetical protein GC157_02380 [Frankiales bacterium]|nr:hypothetical protein [Frankiales bacterium]